MTLDSSIRQGVRVPGRVDSMEITGVAALVGPVAVGSVFRWKSGASSLTSTLEVVDRPNEIAWTGTTMSIKAIHVFQLRSDEGGTLVRSQESWEGFIASLLKGDSRKAIHRAIKHILSGLEQEAERRAAGTPPGA